MFFWFRICRDTYYSFLSNDGWAIASHIALSTLTSLFPFLIFVAAVAGYFGTQELADEAARLLFQSWPEQVAQPIAAELHNVLTQPRGGLLTASALLALYFSSSGIEALRIGLNRAYGERETRYWLVLRFESILYVLIGAIALLLLALLVVFAPLVWQSVELRFPLLSRHWSFDAMPRYVLTAGVLTLALFIAHKWLPAGQRRAAEVAPGVGLTLVLSLVFAASFGQYLAEFARNYVSTYAGLASFMIALVFLYSLAFIFLLGGELNATLKRAAKPR